MSDWGKGTAEERAARIADAVQPKLLEAVERVQGFYRAALFARDTLKDLQESRAILHGHFCMPGQYHCSEYLALGELRASERGARALAAIAHRFDFLLEGSCFDVLLVHSRPMLHVAWRLAELREQQGKPVGILVGGGYRRPSLFGTREELRGARTILLVDVVNTGAGIEALADRAESDGASVEAVLSVAELQQYSGRLRPLMRSLISRSVPVYRSHTECPMCRSGEFLETVNIDEARPRGYGWGFPRIAHPDAISDLMAENAPLWKTAKMTNAFDAHAVFKDVETAEEIHVKPRIDVGTLLRSKVGRELLKESALPVLDEVLAPASTIILVPPRRRVPGILMEFLLGERQCAYKVLQAKVERGVCTVPVEAKPNGQRIVCADTAFGTGRTMEMLIRASVRAGYSVQDSFVLLDRSGREEQLDSFEGRLGVRVHAAFRVPYRVVRTGPDGKGCSYCERDKERGQFAERLRDSGSKEAYERVTRRPRFPRRQRTVLQYSLFPTPEDYNAAVEVNWLIQTASETGSGRRIAERLSSEAPRDLRKALLIDALPRELLQLPEASIAVEGIASNGVGIGLLSSACLRLAEMDDFSWFGPAWLSEHATTLFARSGNRGGSGRAWQFLLPVCDRAAQLHPTLIRGLLRAACSLKKADIKVSEQSVSDFIDHLESLTEMVDGASERGI